MPAFALLQNQNNVIESGLKSLRRSKLLKYAEFCEMFEAIEKHHKDVKLAHLLSQPVDIVQRDEQDGRFYFILMKMLQEIQSLPENEQLQSLVQVYLWYEDNGVFITDRRPRFGSNKKSAKSSLESPRMQKEKQPATVTPSELELADDTWLENEQDQGNDAEEQEMLEVGAASVSTEEASRSSLQQQQQTIISASQGPPAPVKSSLSLPVKTPPLTHIYNPLVTAFDRLPGVGDTSQPPDDTPLPDMQNSRPFSSGRVSQLSSGRQAGDMTSARLSTDSAHQRQRLLTFRPLGRPTSGNASASKTLHAGDAALMSAPLEEFYEFTDAYQPNSKQSGSRSRVRSAPVIHPRVASAQPSSLVQQGGGDGGTTLTLNSVVLAAGDGRIASEDTTSRVLLRDVTSCVHNFDLDPVFGQITCTRCGHPASGQLLNSSIYQLQANTNVIDWRGEVVSQLEKSNSRPQSMLSHSFAKKSLRNAGKTHGGSRPKTAPALSGLRDKRPPAEAPSGGEGASDVTADTTPIMPVIHHLGGTSQPQQSSRSYLAYLSNLLKSYRKSQSVERGTVKQFVPIVAPKSIVDTAPVVNPGEGVTLSHVIPQVGFTTPSPVGSSGSHPQPPSTARDPEDPDSDRVSYTETAQSELLFPGDAALTEHTEEGVAGSLAEVVTGSAVEQEFDEDELFSRVSAKADEILARPEYGSYPPQLDNMSDHTMRSRSVRFTLDADSLPPDSSGPHQYLVPWDVGDASLSASNPVFSQHQQQSQSPREPSAGGVPASWVRGKMAALRSGGTTRTAVPRHPSPPRSLSRDIQNGLQQPLPGDPKLLQIRARSAGRTPVNSLCTTPLDLVEKQELMVSKHYERLIAAAPPRPRSAAKTSSRLQWLKDIYSGELISISPDRAPRRPMTGVLLKKVLPQMEGGEKPQVTGDGAEGGVDDLASTLRVVRLQQPPKPSPPAHARDFGDVITHDEFSPVAPVNHGHRVQVLDVGTDANTKKRLFIGRPIPEYGKVVEPDEEARAVHMMALAKAATDVQRIFRGYIARHRYYDLLQSVRNKREDKQIDYMNWKKAYGEHVDRMTAVASRETDPEMVEWAREYKRTLGDRQVDRDIKAVDTATRNKTNWREIRHIRENVGPHVDIDMIYNVPVKELDMAVLNEAACEIQRMVRGWLARVKMERFKQQCREVGLSMTRIARVFKDTLRRTLLFRGKSHPVLKYDIDDLTTFAVLQKRYSGAFEHQSYADELELNRLVRYFTDCDLHPSTIEIEEACALVLRDKDVSKRGLYKQEVLDITYQLYSPSRSVPGLRALIDPVLLAQEGASTWMNPVVNKMEARKFKHKLKLEPVDFDKCWKLVTTSKKDRANQERLKQLSANQKEGTAKAPKSTSSTANKKRSHPRAKAPAKKSRRKQGSAKKTVTFTADVIAAADEGTVNNQESADLDLEVTQQQEEEEEEVEP